MRINLSSKLMWCIFAYRLFICTTMKTAESPDEWWQSVEVAYHMVFNKGLLSWEWKEGIRSAVFPLIYALPMLVLKMMRCDTAWTIWFSSRLVQACIATGIDYCILFVCSNIDDDLEKKELIYNSNNNNNNSSNNVKIRNSGKSINVDVINNNADEYIDEARKKCVEVRKNEYFQCKTTVNELSSWPISTSVTTTALPFLLCQWYLTYDGARCYSNVAETLLVSLSLIQENYVVFLVYAALSCMVRITSFMPLLLIFAAHVSWQVQHRGWRRGVIYCFLIALPIGVIALAFMSLVDYTFYKHWIFTPLRFVHYNLTMKISALYGTHPWYDYFIARLPVILGPHLIFLFCIPYSIHHTRTTRLVRRRIIYFSAFVLWTLICYSFVAHKEFRFILPVLPTCIVLVSYVLSTIVREAKSNKATKQQLSFAKLVRWLHVTFLVVNILALIFCGYWHRQGGLNVMREIRNSQEHYNRLDVIAPCFFTPGLSFIHNKVNEFYFPNCPIKLHQKTRKLLPHDDFLYRQNPVRFVNWKYIRKIPTRDEIDEDYEWWQAAFTLLPVTNAIDLPDALALFEDVAREVNNTILIPNGYELRWRLYHATGKCDEDYTKFIDVYTRKNDNEK